MYKTPKNVRLTFYCTCAKCGIKKLNLHLKAGKLKSLSEMAGKGVISDLGNIGAEMLFTKGIPYLGKKAVEVGRYYGSEALRNPKLQKKKQLTMLWISLIQLFKTLDLKLLINCQPR